MLQPQQRDDDDAHGVVAVRNVPKISFRLGETPPANSDPLRCQPWCSTDSARPVRRGPSAGEAKGEEPLFPESDDSLSREESPGADGSSFSVRGRSSGADIANFAAFAARHLGGMLMTLASQYEQGPTPDRSTKFQGTIIPMLPYRMFTPGGEPTMSATGSGSTDTSDAPWAPGSQVWYSPQLLEGRSTQSTPMRRSNRNMETVPEASSSVTSSSSQIHQDDHESSSSSTSSLDHVEEEVEAVLASVENQMSDPALLSGDHSGANVRSEREKRSWVRDVSYNSARYYGELDSMTQSETRTFYNSHSHRLPLGDGNLPDWVKKTIRPRSHESHIGRSWYDPRRIWAQWQISHTKSTEREIKRAARMRAYRTQRKLFSSAVVSFVLINAAFVLAQLQYLVTHSCPPSHMHILSMVFSCLFTVELLCRLARLGTTFYSLSARWCAEGFWNLVDLCILILLWVQQVLRYVLEDCPPVLAWDVSIFRVIRIFGVIHTMSKEARWQEIRLLTQVMQVALKSWLWIMMLTSILIYLCSAVVAFGAYPLCNDAEDSLDPGRRKLCRHFSNFEETYLSLCKALFGGILWGDLIEAMQAAPFAYQAVVGFLISFGVIVVANLATGIFIQVSAEGKKEDIETMIAAEERETTIFLQAMQGIFREIDANHSGAISKEEMELALEEPQMHALLRCFKLEVHDAQLLFDLLDVDQSDSIDMEEFIGGCLRMKGGAQAIDIVRLQMQMHEVRQAISASLKGRNLDMIMEEPSTGFGNGQRHVNGWERQTSAQSNFQPPVWASSASGRSHSHSTSSPIPHVPANGAGNGYVAHVPSILASSMPSWVGSRIAKVEERAMMLTELRTLRSQIKLHINTWQAEKTCKALRARKVNLYDVNYNWICPLTIPEGVILGGLHLRPDVQIGTIVSQSPKCGFAGPRALGEVVSITGDRRLKVKVFRGQFTDISWGEAPVTLGGRESCGTPTTVTSPLSMSYKELISASPTKPDWYCCHWWGEPMMDFITCLEEHVQLRHGTGSSSYWVCAFANSQHDLEAELADDPEKSSFRRAMSLAVGVLLVLDRDATPFQRIWCDYELYKTLLDESKMLDIVTVAEAKGRKKAQVLAELPGESAVKKTMREASFPVGVLIKGIKAKLELGEATVAKDKERILHYMRKEVELTKNSANGVLNRSNSKGPFAQTLGVATLGISRSRSFEPGPEPVDSPMEQALTNQNSGLEVANYTLNAFFAWAAWPQALKQGIVKAFGPTTYSPDGPREPVALPLVTSQDCLRQSLTLSLAHFSEVNDSAIQDLAKGFPSNLTELSLSFEGCSHISDRGLQNLCHGLTRLWRLQRLSLDFLGCKRISDIGLEHLSRNLPRGLVKLRLDFAKCTAIGLTGLAALANNLPAGLRDFSSTFKGTAVDRNFESADQLRRAVREQASSGRATPTALSYALFGST